MGEQDQVRQTQVQGWGCGNTTISAPSISDILGLFLPLPSSCLQGWLCCLFEALSGGRSAISPLFSMRQLGMYEVGLGQPPASWFIQVLLCCYLLLWGALFVGRWQGPRKGFIPGLCLSLSSKLWSITYRMALPFAF